MEKNIYTRSYGGYYFTYDGTNISLYLYKGDTTPHISSTINLKSEKDFEVEIMWMHAHYGGSE